MFFAILLALIAIGAGYYIHKQFSPAAATPEVSIPDGSKREKSIASKRDVPNVVSNRSVYDTAATEPSLRSTVDRTQTQTEEKSNVEPQRDESSRDVKTARSPSITEIPSRVSVADAASTVDGNNNILLVKDSEGGLGTDPLSKRPASKTPVAPEAEPSLQSAVDETQTQNGEKSKTEQTQGDESSRDVKTARTPTSAENPLHAAAPTADANNNGILVKDSEGGVGANPVSKPPTSKTPVPIAVFEIGNLPDSTARNASPNPVASKQEVKPDQASANALPEKTAIETSLQSAIGGNETQKGTGEKFNTEQPKRDESSHDVETARSPSVAETPSAIASAATVADVYNNGILIKDSEGGKWYPPSPPIQSPVPIKGFEFGNASPDPGPSDSAANNSSPNPGPSNQEVKPDLATAIDLSEKKKTKKSGKKSKKAKKSSKKEKKDKKEKKAKKSKKEKKSKEIKSADGACD